MTESVDISTDESTGLVEYSSTTNATDENGATRYSTSVVLTETAAGSNAYAGSSTHTPASGTAQSYTVTLADPTDTSATSAMTVGGEDTTAYFPVTRREAKNIIVELRNGGTFTGRMKGRILSGLYRAFRSGDSASVEAALSFIYAITGTQVQLR